MPIKIRVCCRIMIFTYTSKNFDHVYKVNNPICFFCPTSISETTIISTIRVCTVMETQEKGFSSVIQSDFFSRKSCANSEYVPKYCKQIKMVQKRSTAPQFLKITIKRALLKATIFVWIVLSMIRKPLNINTRILSNHVYFFRK